MKLLAGIDNNTRIHLSSSTSHSWWIDLEEREALRPQCHPKFMRDYTHSKYELYNNNS